MDESSTQDYQSPDGDLDQDIDFDFDDDEYDENADLMRILGIAGGVAALVGGLIILLGRKRETPAERLVAQAGQTARDVRKAVDRADLGSLLNDALDQVNARVQDANVPDLARNAGRTGRQAARAVSDAAGQVDLEDAIGEIRDRLAAIEQGGRRGAGRARKEARRAFGDLNLDDLPDEVSTQLADLWQQVSQRAEDVGWAAAIDEARKQVRKLGRQARRGGGGVDVGGLRTILEDLRDRLGEASDRVGQDVLPAVGSSLQDDVLPRARKQAQQAGETLSAVADEARKRGGKLADTYAPGASKQAGKAAEGAKGLASQVGDLLRVVALEALDRMMSDVMPAAKQGGEQVASTVRDDTLPWLRHRAGEVRDRMRDDVGPAVGDAASKAPGMVRDAVGTAGPVVGETLGNAAQAVGDAVARARPKVGDAVESGRGKVADAAQAGGAGVGGALSTIGQKAGDAAGATLDTTRYVTGESGRILFWLSVLTGLVLVVFVPDPDKQKEIWNNMQQFFGELRNMWGDFSGDDLAADPAGSPDYTGDASV